jgi:glutaconate CoA-transferase subunit B
MNFTIQEQLAYAVSRELKDGELAFIGLGVGGPAFTRAVGIPAVGIRLAQLTHAPNFITMFGVQVEPDLDAMPITFADWALLEWKAKARLDVEDALGMFKRGMMDIGFISGAQIDMYGNLNSVCIGEYARPSVRLVGPIAQADHAAYAGRTIIIMPHTLRNFVERVDFISAVGYLDGPGARERLGLPGGGPSKVFTDLGVFDFDQQTRRLRLHNLNPGVTLDQVKENTGFELVLPASIPETTPPPPEIIKLIREQIDPTGYFLNGKVT